MWHLKFWHKNWELATLATLYSWVLNVNKNCFQNSILDGPWFDEKKCFVIIVIHTNEISTLIVYPESNTRKWQTFSEVSLVLWLARQRQVRKKLPSGKKLVSWPKSWKSAISKNPKCFVKRLNSKLTPFWKGRWTIETWHLKLCQRFVLRIAFTTLLWIDLKISFKFVR